MYGNMAQYRNLSYVRFEPVAQLFQINTTATGRNVQLAETAIESPFLWTRLLNTTFRSEPSVLKSGPVLLFCYFWTNRNRHWLPNTSAKSQDQWIDL